MIGAYTVEVIGPRNWRWRPFLVSEPLHRATDVRHLFEGTHSPAIYLPELLATVYWPRPLHLPVRWAYKAYVWWLWYFIFPMARHVLVQGVAIWLPLHWPLNLFEWHGEPPILRRTEETPILSGLALDQFRHAVETVTTPDATGVVSHRTVEWRDWFGTTELRKYPGLWIDPRCKELLSEIDCLPAHFAPDLASATGNEYD